MAITQGTALYEMIFTKIIYGGPGGFTAYPDIDAELAALWADIYNVSLAGKMDLVPLAVANNFASFDAAGQVKDSLKNTGTYALTGHVHSNYLRGDAAITYDATLLTGHRFEFHVADEAPFFIDNTSGDILPVVTHLNADLLDSKHASYFAKSDHLHGIYVEKAFNAVTNTFAITNDATHAPFTVSDPTVIVTNLNADLLDSNEASYFAKSDHNHGIYPNKDSGSVTITANWTFDRVGTGVAPFILASDQTGLVQYLNADKLDSLDSTAFSLIAHTHAWGIITAGTLADQTDLKAALDAKLAIPSGSSVDPTGLLIGRDAFGTGAVRQYLAVGDIALEADVALKYDEVAGVNNNFPAFATLGTTLVDSGYAASSFALAAHDHNTIYFTETEFGAGTLTISIDQLTIASKLTLTSNTAAGAAAGTLTNAVVAGNPSKWADVYIGAVKYLVPLFPSV